MKRNYPLVLIVPIILLLAQSVIAETVNFASITNQESLKLLNDVKLIHEKPGLPLNVRIWTLQDDGECGPDYTGCPGTTLFIAISSIDEYPDRIIYESKKAYGWEFDKWISHAASDVPGEYEEFLVWMESICSKSESTKIKRDLLKISINLNKIKTQILKTEY